MQARQIRPWRLRAAAILGVLVAAGAGLAAPAASAASLTPAAPAAPTAPGIVIPLTPTDPLTAGPGVAEVEHKCFIIGDEIFSDPPGSTTDSVDAVNCTDVFILTIGGTTGNEVVVQNEIVCQWATGPREGTSFACSGVDEQIGAGSPLGTAALPAQLCGTIFGQTHSPCTSGRTKHAAFAFAYQPEPVDSAPVKCSIWAESLRVSVILPISGHPTVSDTELPTDHVNVFSNTNARGYCLDV